MAVPLFSIIIPSFNGAAKLRATLDSVFDGETAAEIECLVVDGGSTDGTIPLLEQEGSRLRWISEPDAGIYDAMNKGIVMAQGRFLYFLGLGDRLRPGVLDHVATLITELGTIEPTTNPLFLYGNVLWESRGLVYAGEFTSIKFLTVNICHQCIFYDARIFSRLGLYDTKYRYSSDHLMNIRCWSDPGIRKEYVDLIVADYEGKGGSSENPDVQFLVDQPRIAARYFGWTYGVRLRGIRTRYQIVRFLRRRLRHCKPLLRFISAIKRQRRDQSS